jgi:hypothetical protein
MTGDKIIKKSDWAGSYIPIIPVFGEVKNIEGKKYRKSLIRDAKEPQRINNYFLSAEVESVALQPKAPFIGPVGAFETDQKKWATANLDNHAYLQYDVVENAPPPMRAPPPEFPAALREVRMASIEAMKACMGIYDASLGARSNETSGVAIENRAVQGQQSTYHYIDNMTRAIRYAGTVIIDLLPKVYDAPRVVRLLEPDGEASMVAINQMFIDKTTMQPQQFDVKTGRYDVVVKAGPNYESQRAENAAVIRELIKAYPPLAQMAGDLLIKSMDFPDADKIAERMKPATSDNIPPQLKQHMDQMQHMIQEGSQKLQQLTAENLQQKVQIAGKALEAQQAKAELQMRDMQPEQQPPDTSQMDAQVKLEVARIGAEAQIEVARIKAQADAMNKELDRRMQAMSAQMAGVNLPPDEQTPEGQAKLQEQEQQKQQDAQQKQQDAQASQKRDQTQEQLAQHLAALAHHMARPKKIVRGPDGRATGVE